MKSLKKCASHVLLANPQYIDLRPLDPKLRRAFLIAMSDYVGYNKIYAVPRNQFLGLLHLKYNLPESNSNLHTRFITMVIANGIITKQYHKISDNILYDFGLTIAQGKFTYKQNDMYVVTDTNTARILFKPANSNEMLYITATPHATKLIRELKEFSGAKHSIATLIATDKLLIHDCPPRNTLVDLCIIALSRAPQCVSLLMPFELINKMQYALAYQHFTPSKPLIFVNLGRLLTVLTLEHPQHVYIAAGKLSAKIYIRSGKHIYKQYTRLGDTVQVYQLPGLLASKGIPLDCQYALQNISKDKSKLVANVSDGSIECIYSMKRPPAPYSPELVLNLNDIVGLEPLPYIMRLQKKYASVDTLSVFSRVVDFPIEYLTKS